MDEETYPRRVAKLLGERVRAERTRRGWTQDDLARRMSEQGFQMHQTTVGKLETAARPTPVEEVAALAILLDLSVSELLEASPDDASLKIELMRISGRLVVLANELRTHKEAEVALLEERQLLRREFGRLVRLVEERTGQPYLAGEEAAWLDLLDPDEGEG